MSIHRRTPDDTAFGDADVGAAGMFPALTAPDEQRATRNTTWEENPGTG